MSLLDAKREHWEEQYRNLDLTEQTLHSSEFEQCTFHRCKFTEATLQNCRFVDCAFEHCDLSLAIVRESSFHRVHFNDTKALGINWSDANWMPGFSSINFVECGVSYSVFMGLEARKLVMRGCVAQEVNFEGTDLTDADLRNTDFMGSRFANTNLTRANLRGARNYDINPATNTVKGAKFSLPEAIALLRAFDIVLDDVEEGDT